MAAGVMIRWTIDRRRRRQPSEQEMLAAIVEQSSDAVISCDLGGIVTSWNSGAERIYGYRADEVIGKPLTDPGSFL
ncbi:PAS domain S-box protein [Actinoplanes sp. CA-015351]|uniref:PAS domain S-box protein n=1 Tax=Actinoplanes sp. CA-015351 TaxID=3239897 RepID=UPI003D990B65